MFAFMIKDLPKLTYLGQTLSVDNSYQYGPVCIDKSVRGSGLLEKLFILHLKLCQKNTQSLLPF